MHFQRTPIEGVWVIDPERRHDERGWFARVFDERELASRGLRTSFPQCSVSHNRRTGTLRGLHLQAPPHEEAKLIRCTAGAVFDVAVDVRHGSPTRGAWHAVELSAANGRLVYLAEGIAHGFQTLVDDSELFYQISSAYEPSAARGYRWDDPAFGIEWPRADERIIAGKDLAWPLVDGADR